MIFCKYTIILNKFTISLFQSFGKSKMFLLFFSHQFFISSRPSQPSPCLRFSFSSSIFNSTTLYLFLGLITHLFIIVYKLYLLVLMLKII